MSLGMNLICYTQSIFLKTNITKENINFLK